MGEGVNEAAGAAEAQGQSDGERPPQTWAEFVAIHPEAQALHEAETAGLRTALEKEREKAKTAERNYRELAKTADPETAEKLRKLADETKAESERLKAQLDFTTAAVRLGCRAPDKAWAVAQALGLSAEQMKADPDWSALFVEPRRPDAKPGVGTGAPPPAGKTPSMQISDNIRRAAGYGR